MSKNINRNIRIGEKSPLVKDVLIIEGISRSGKFLLANVLHGFEGLEHVQYYGLLEHIPFLEKFGLIDRDVAKEILRCEIDSHCYEMLIGRNLNYRKTDKSSIYNNPRVVSFLKRCEQPDGDAAIRKYNREKLCSMFITHELMPNIEIYFETFPYIKVISILRSPVYLVYSWYSRGLGKRFGDDPKLFSLPLSEGKNNIPWFAVDWGKKYLQLSEMDRSIASIEWLTNASEKSYDKLNPKNKDKILHISYENLLIETNKTLKKIEKFLGRRVLKREMKIIFKQEKLPNLNYSDSKKDKLLEIKKKSSPQYFDKLMDLEKQYLKGIDSP